MPGAAASFKIADLVRAIKSFNKCGMTVSRLEIDPATGRIIVVAEGARSEPQNDLDRWLERHANSPERS